MGKQSICLMAVAILVVMVVPSMASATQARGAIGESVNLDSGIINRIFTNVAICQNLTSPGTYNLTADLVGVVTGTSYCLDVQTTNVIIDCKGHSITGDDSETIMAIHTISAHLTVQNCIISHYGGSGGANGDGIFSDNNYLTATNNTIRYCAIGIYMDGGSYHIIRNNTINHIGSVGIYLWTSNYDVISDNNVSYASGNLMSAILLRDSSTYNYIGNNSFYHNIYGMQIYNSGTNYNTFYNNTADHNFRGIYINQASSPYPTHELFTNNTITNSTSDGMTATLYSSTFTNNTFSYNSGNGISLYACVSNQFIGNRMGSNAIYDIEVASSSYNSFTNQKFISTHQTVTNFTFSGDLRLQGVTIPPSNPSSLYNINKYINITNQSGAWLNINISYSHSDLGAINESDLRMSRYSGSWVTNPATFASHYGVDTTHDRVWANITDFGSTFAPLGSLKPHYNITLYDDPTDGGTITFNGTEYSNGEHEDVYADDYTVVANPASGYHFDSWNTSTNITILGGTATVIGNGSITANFTSDYHYTVTLNDNPSTKGTITFNGTLYLNGQSASAYAGDYAVSANPSDYYELDSWSTSANITIVGGIATVIGNGTIAANYIPIWYDIDFFVSPDTGGNITFDGIDYANDSFVSIISGIYDITANPASSYIWDGMWVGADGLVVNPPTGDLAAVIGDGSLTANFIYSPLHYNITLYDTPASAGTITFNGTIYSNGQIANVLAGVYDFSANPAAGYAFDSWDRTGNVSIHLTHAIVYGNGTITANYLPLVVTYTITFNINPTSRGTITFDGLEYSHGESVVVAAGDYLIEANPSSGYEFSSWSRTGGVVIAGGVATVTGDGTITLNVAKEAVTPPPSDGGGGAGGFPSTIQIGNVAVPTGFVILGVIVFLIALVVLWKRR